MALECVIVNTGMFIIEYVHSTLFISMIIANLGISIWYLCIHISEPKIFCVWALSSLTLHIGSYAMYITRPINGHPNIVRRLLRAVLPAKVWKLLLFRWLYKKVENYPIFSHLIHMLGMLTFCLIFGFYINPELHQNYNKHDSGKEAEVDMGKFAFISSICLGLDIFIMEILIAISMVPVLPISALIYVCSYCCCWSGIRTIMNEKQGDDEDSEEEESDFFRNFKKGRTLQQLLLYIYKHNKIIFRKANFRDHCEEVTTNPILSPDKNENDSFFGEEILKNGRPREESFLTNDVSRKISEMGLIDDVSLNQSPDTSLTPVRAYDPAIQAFIEEVHKEFSLDSDVNEKPISIKERKSEEKKITDVPSTKEKPGRKMTENIILVKKKGLKKVHKNSQASFKIRGRSSMKKIERGILCSICQDDAQENDSMLQLDCGRTHILHFNCLKEWIARKPECPSCRSDLFKLYSSKILDEGKKNSELYQYNECLYAEDLIPLRKAKLNLFEEIEYLENLEKKEESASLNILQRL
ncbi:unnamed protein product [Moneuplotes crassus]|uniref:RING-type E3 ubiquitin transferase n=1 Tax=Euplotes crassus TaxID=5936 RepID=A0AAD1UB43_EUPCR|nr:unnamed protein product [Moneuplotes crassus]